MIQPNKPNTKLLILLAFFVYSFSAFAQSNSGAPQFNGPKITGNYPNTDFLFTVPVSGQKPISFKAENLPAGLSIDESTGIITGNVKEKGIYATTITATNAAGTNKQNITINIGDKLCLTPLMGWNTWNVFTYDISEKMLMEMADAMVSSGMRDLGYQYINIDDFWHADVREKNGKPKVDSVKFPHGMKYLSDYIHSKGLKLGIYSCAGTMTCGKRFGGYNYEEIDAKTYAEWGIDLLKYDYCFAPWGRKTAEERYTKMGTALKNSERSIVFSVCEWGIRKPWLWAKNTGGSYWRITPDIFDVWNHPAVWQYSVMAILKRAEKVSKYSFPGGWNDMDMMLVGNYGNGKATSANGMFKGLTDLEYESHMALWCLFNSPLLASCDLRTMNDATKNILTNSNLLNISQNTLGKSAKLVSKKNGIRMFEKELLGGAKIIAVLNYSEKEKSLKGYFNKKELSELNHAQNVLSGKNMSQSELETLNIKPHQTIIFKLTGK